MAVIDSLLAFSLLARALQNVHCGVASNTMRRVTRRSVATVIGCGPGVAWTTQRAVHNAGVSPVLRSHRAARRLGRGGRGFEVLPVGLVGSGLGPMCNRRLHVEVKPATVGCTSRSRSQRWQMSGSSEKS